MTKSKKEANKSNKDKMSKEQEENLQSQEAEQKQSEEVKDEKEVCEEEKTEENVIEELENKQRELNDKYLRLYSEFDNFRKRTMKEKADLSKYAGEKTVKAILPILDDFERAIQSLESSEADNAHEGVSLIFNKLSGVLEKEGLKPIDAMGKEFDTDFHEAITQIPAPEKSLKGKVVDVVEKGYELNGKVIRFAKVVVGC